MTTKYEQLQAQIEAARPMDEAWDRLCAAERAGKPSAELERLYDAYHTELERYIAWLQSQRASEETTR